MNDNQYGMRDYYKFFCEQNPSIKISKQKFNSIISEFNKIMAKDLIDELVIPLPYRLGKIEILKTKRSAYYDKFGILKNNIPIDWKATKELWKKDKDSKEKKILVRYKNTNTNGYVFKVYYTKTNAVYTNKILYSFKPVRSVSRSITARINDYSLGSRD